MYNYVLYEKKMINKNKTAEFSSVYLLNVFAFDTAVAEKAS